MLQIGPVATHQTPALIAAASDQAQKRFLEFFTAARAWSLPFSRPPGRAK
jgi:hypothetical protein